MPCGEIQLLLSMQKRKYHALRGFVERLFLIDALAATILAGCWYSLFSRYNRRRGMRVLHWIEVACSGEARIVQPRWLSASRLQAQLRCASHWFDHASVTVRLFPRPLLFQWLISLCRQQKETLTFEADLDSVPGFPLEVFRHHWFTRRQVSIDAIPHEWSVFRPGPVVFTTRPQWTEDVPPVVHTFMTSRGHRLMSVHFRPESPHLAATVALEVLADQEGAAGFMSVLRDLAAGASTLRQ
jgi:hypothetical protein